MSIAVLDFKPVSKGALLGFLTIRYHGLSIRNCRLMTGSSGPWIALPQEKCDQGGETKYYDLLHLSRPEADHLKCTVLSALRSQGHLPSDTEKTSNGQNRPKNGDKLPPNGQQRGQRPTRAHVSPEGEDLSSYYPGPDAAADDVPF